jgi:RimJ/RimL family protein N-acetyltransferase
VITVRPAPPEHYPWIAERAQLVLSPGFRAIEAVDAEERILGMVGFDGWTPGAVSMHQAIEHPIALRRLLGPAFGIAFDPPPLGAGKRTVIGTVLSTNAAALRLDRHVGFREVGRITDGWDAGVDLVMLEMRKEDCRWIRSPSRQGERSD